MAVFKWSDQRRKAAELLADGNLTDAEIAEQIGVTRQTIWTWRKAPEFTTVVDGHLDAFREQVRRRGIAVRERRVNALNDRWMRMRSVIEQRAEDPRMVGVPGGPTGLIVHNVKGVGKGEDFQLIDLYEVDTGLLKEFREHEKQAAQELGQWVEKQETKGEMSHTIVDALAEDLDRSFGEPGDDADDFDPV